MVILTLAFSLLEGAFVLPAHVSHSKALTPPEEKEEEKLIMEVQEGDWYFEEYLFSAYGGGTAVWDLVDGKRSVRRIVRIFAEDHRPPAQPRLFLGHAPTDGLGRIRRLTGAAPLVWRKEEGPP